MVSIKKINSACLVIIGNEILSGRTQDKNINHIAKELFICGISLQLVVVIPDQKKIKIQAGNKSFLCFSPREIPCVLGIKHFWLICLLYPAFQNSGIPDFRILEFLNS